MLKKSIMSTLLFTLVVVNLILWPYLYKQAKPALDPATYEETVGENDPSAGEGSLEETVGDDQESDTGDPSDDEEISEEETTQANSDDFQVVDIK